MSICVRASFCRQREFLEKHWEEGADRDASVKLAVKSLLEIVENGAKSIEVCVTTRDGVVTLGDEEVEAICKTIEEEAEAAAAAGAGGSS